MKISRFFLCVLCAAAAFAPCATGTAQTVIDLNRGGKVRGKTLGDYHAESTDLQLRAQRDSVEWMNHLRLGFSAVQVDSFAVAEKHFRAALKLRPSAAGAEVVQQNLAAALMAQSKWDEAAREMTRLLRRNPAHVEARFLRAEAQLELEHAPEVMADAEALLQSAALSSEQRTRAHLLHGAARSLQRRFAEALQDYDAARRSAPRDAQPVILAAATCVRLNRHAEAIERLTAFLALQPESVEALTARADLYAAQQRYVEARQDLDEALRLDASDAASYIARAEVLIALGEKAAARRDLDAALRLGATQGEVHALYQQTK